MPRTPRLATLGCVFCLCTNPGAPIPAHASHDRTQPLSLDGAGWPLSAFTLVDQHGRAFTQAALLGRWTFILFGDGRRAAAGTSASADALAALAGLYQRIAGTAVLERTQVLFISLDPEHASPDRLRHYLAPYDSRFIAATGPRAVLHTLGDDLGLAATGEAMGHGGTVWLIGPDGSIRSAFQPPFDVPLLTAAFLKTRVRG